MIRSDPHLTAPSVLITAVLGVCTPEAARVAAALPGAVRLATAAETEHGAEASLLHAAASLPAGGSIVVQCLSAVTAHDLIALFADHGGPLPDHLHLTEIVTVVDAMHLMTDLEGRRVIDRAWAGRPETEPLAAVAIDQIEHCDTLIMTGWRRSSRSHLARLLSLLSHLNPDARLTMFRPIRGRRPLHAQTRRSTSPGWVRVLNAEFDPHVTGGGVTAFRYEQLRPFHPERLRLLLESGFEHLHGQLIRSAGLCRIATRPGVTAKWDQIGSRIAFQPLAPDGAEDDPLSIGQEIAFIGIELRPESLTAALDSCVLTDDELAEGPSAWQRYPDPLPSWSDPIPGSPGRS